ncbi:MAG: deoxyribose-phosphate aldolase [Chloroflexi bacterium]|nr:deoxyribose-phosphate aldolase [Chloroflexota bacterium]
MVGQLSPSAVAAYIDHTLLKPEATPGQVEALCAEARAHRFAAVCLNPCYVPLAAGLLQGSPVAVCTVVGFPLGATLAEVKAHEADRCLALGAREVDMVICVGALKAGQDAQVQADIHGVVQAAQAHGGLVKVIIEAALLTEAEKVRACQLAQAAGAHFVKTSTGFGPGGATVDDVALMRRVVGGALGVKAAGGIRTYAQALAMIEAGATRIGASAGVAIVAEAAAASG